MKREFIKAAVGALLALLSMDLLAGRTNCPSALVVQIQIEGQKVLYRQENAPWRTLGVLSSEDGTRERYSALLAAQAAGKTVMVAYRDDNYDCNKVNYGTSAYLVRVSN